MADQPVLSVLVSATCPTCGQALALAHQLAQEQPDVRVRVIDVDLPESFAAHHWPGFAGTPMFYLGDAILSYGNPTLPELRRAVLKEVA